MIGSSFARDVSLYNEVPIEFRK